MSDDDQNEHEGFRIIEGGEPVDDDVIAPGRSVFGDDDPSFDDDDDSLPHWSEPATGQVPLRSPQTIQRSGPPWLRQSSTSRAPTLF